MKAEITVACFFVCSLATCVGPTLRAQAAQAAPPPAHPVEVSTNDSTNDLYVTVGKSVLVDTAKPVVRITVGLGGFAEATAISRSEILVNGHAPGQTTMIVWDAQGGRQFFNLTVVPSTYLVHDRLDGLRRELRKEFPGQKISVSSENDLIFLGGTVKDLDSSKRAVEIASTAGKVVNLLYVDVPASKPQILLKVRFASVDRTLTKQLGINLFSTGATNTLGAVSTGQFPAPTVSLPTSGQPAEALVSNALNLFFFRPDLNLGATMQALETKGLVQLLAEPNLLAEDGAEASFLAGGEYPYPVVQGVTGGGTGAVTIQFKEFGVRLNFIPTITPRNTIRLQVAPEVSSLDFTNQVVVSGFQIPAIDVRNVKTEIELKDGQSFAIGGLLDNRETETFQKIPFIGDIPILGKFFQSISKSRSNTELMVIVTAEIVAPIPAGQPLPELKYPAKFMPPNSGIPMTTPGASVTGAEPLSPTPPSMPVESLIESMKPEKPLVVDNSSGGQGSSQGASSSGSFH
ncbi:MAG: pilus assembly protein N-terminal domain-containing protein [Acidobacteriaceae bacterium]